MITLTLKSGYIFEHVCKVLFTDNTVYIYQTNTDYCTVCKISEIDSIVESEK